MEDKSGEVKDECGGIVQGQLHRSQGRRNGKVLTGAGEIVLFSLADSTWSLETYWSCAAEWNSW